MHCLCICLWHSLQLCRISCQRLLAEDLHSYKLEKLKEIFHIIVTAVVSDRVFLPKILPLTIFHIFAPCLSKTILILVLVLWKDIHICVYIFAYIAL